MPSTLQTVQLAHVLPQPWKNGGGSTCELLTWPSAAAWGLRLSVATIDRDGPFSAFEGVDRWFAVIEGAGVELQLAHGLYRLEAGDEPLAFDGAQAPDCRLIGGATRDLNLMVRRSAGRGQMLRAHAGAAWTRAASWRGVYVQQAVQLFRDGHAPQALPALSLAYSDAAGEEAWDLRLPGEAPGGRPHHVGWWLAFEPAAAGAESGT